MSRALRILAIAAAVAVPLSLSLAAKKSADPAEPDPETYFAGKSASETADALITRSLAAAGDGSWEQIEIARLWYLGGTKKDEAKKIFDRYSVATSKEKGDFYRIAKVYCEAKEWTAARPLFDRALALDPKWRKALRAAGACAYAAGDKAAAEDYFTRAIADKPDDTWTLSAIAAVYLGLPPNLD